MMPLAVRLSDGQAGQPIFDEPCEQIWTTQWLPGWVRWAPGGKSLVYTVTKKGIGNLWSQPDAAFASTPKPASPRL